MSIRTYITCLCLVVPVLSGCGPESVGRHFDNSAEMPRETPIDSAGDGTGNGPTVRDPRDSSRVPTASGWLSPSRHDTRDAPPVCDGEPVDVDACGALVDRIEMCFEDHEDLCTADIDAVYQCYDETLAACELLDDALDDCLFTGNDDCGPAEDAADACYANLDQACTTEEEAADACFAACEALEDDLDTVCACDGPPPGPPQECPPPLDLCGHLEEALTQCEGALGVDAAACQAIVVALDDAC